MPLSPEHRNLVDEINNTRDSIGRAEERLHKAKHAFARVEHANPQKIFKDMTEDDGHIHGERIIDFLEASIRSNGSGASYAREQAKKLIPVFAPTKGADATTVYFEKGGAAGRMHAKDNFVYTTNQTEQADQPNYTLKEGYNSEEYVLEVVLDSNTPVFKQLSNSAWCSYWTASRSARTGMLFGDGRILSEPSAVSRSPHDFGNIFVGEAAIARMVRDVESFSTRSDSYDPSSLAVLDIVIAPNEVKPTDLLEEGKLSDQDAPAFREKTLHDIELYIKTMFPYGKNETQAKQTIMRYGMPMLMHNSVVSKFDINEEAIGEVVLSGLLSGNIFTLEDAEEIIKLRKAANTSKVESILFGALDRRIEDLHEAMGDAASLGAFAVPDAIIKQMAKKQPSILGGNILSVADWDNPLDSKRRLAYNVLKELIDT